MSAPITPPRPSSNSLPSIPSNDRSPTPPPLPVPFGQIRGVAVVHSRGGHVHVPVSPDVNEVLTALRQSQIYDFLQLAKNVEVKRFLATSCRYLLTDGVSWTMETVQFSDSVIKINRREKRQERTLIITNKALYNFIPKAYSKPKRRIAVETIKNIVLSRSSDEMVFQVESSYDYRMIVRHRAELMEILTKIYEKESGGKQLPITFTEEKELRDVVITKPQLRSRISPRGSHSTDHYTSEVHSSLPSNRDSDAFSPRTVNRGVALEGWLTKKKGKSEKWERKFFILAGEYLEYFTPRIKGNLLIEAGLCEIETIEDFETGHTVKYYHKSEGTINHSNTSNTSNTPPVLPFLKYRIRITSSTRRQPFEMAAESLEEKDGWLHALRARLSDDKKGRYHYEGWIMKRDPTSKNWRRRYAILHQYRLWYFEMSLKGNVDMTAGVSAHAAEILPTEKEGEWVFAGEVARSKFAYRFNVSDSARIFYFAADNEEDRNIWIKEIEKVCRQFSRAVAAGRSMSTIAPDDSSDRDRHSERVERKVATEIPLDFLESIEQESPVGQVTFVFTDVQNSTNLWEKAPDAMDVALELHDRILREILKKVNGYEVKTEGDAFMVTFFSVMDAILWCIETQIKLNQQDWSDELLELPAARKEIAIDQQGNECTVFSGLRIRMGVHVGFPNCRRNPVTGRMDYFGPVVNRSARVSDTAHGGQIVCTQEVVDALMDYKEKNDTRIVSRFPELTDLGYHDLKGINEPVKIFQVAPLPLLLRKFPPIRTITNEKKAQNEDSDDEGDEEEKEKESYNNNSTIVRSKTPTERTERSASALPPPLPFTKSDFPSSTASYSYSSSYSAYSSYSSYLLPHRASAAATVSPERLPIQAASPPPLPPLTGSSLPKPLPLPPPLRTNAAAKSVSPPTSPTFLNHSSLPSNTVTNAAGAILVPVLPQGKNSPNFAAILAEKASRRAVSPPISPPVSPRLSSVSPPFKSLYSPNAPPPLRPRPDGE